MNRLNLAVSCLCLAVVVTTTAKLKIIAANHPDTLVVTIALEHFLAEPEKSEIR